MIDFIFCACDTYNLIWFEYNTLSKCYAIVMYSIPCWCVSRSSLLSTVEECQAALEFFQSMCLGFWKDKNKDRLIKKKSIDKNALIFPFFVYLHEYKSAQRRYQQCDIPICGVATADNSLHSFNLLICSSLVSPGRKSQSSECSSHPEYMPCFPGPQHYLDWAVSLWCSGKNLMSP